MDVSKIAGWVTETVNEMTFNKLVKLTTLWTTGPWWVTNSVAIASIILICTVCSDLFAQLFRVSTVLAQEFQLHLYRQIYAIAIVIPAALWEKGFYHICRQHMRMKAAKS